MELAITIGVSIFTLLLGGLVFYQDPGKRYLRLFGLMCIFIVLWVVSNYVTNFSGSDVVITDAANKIAFLTGYATVFTGLIFTYHFPVTKRVSSLELGAVALLGLLGSIVSTTESVVGRAVVIDGQLSFTSGSWVILYVVCFALVVGLIYRNLIALRKKRKSIEWAQAKLILSAFIVSSAVGLLLNVILPIFLEQWHTTVFGPLAVFFLVVLVSYSIVRHGLFDIRLAVVRSVAYVFSLICLSLLYYLLAYVVSLTLFQGQVSTAVSVNPVNIFLALLLAFLFQPIKKFFDRATDRIFFRDSYRTDDFLNRLSNALAATSDLRSLLKLASNEIAETLKSEHVFFFVRLESGRFMTVGTKGKWSMPSVDIDDLDSFVLENKDTIIINDVTRVSAHIKRILESHRINILVPLVRENVVVGYVALGNKHTGNYTKRDVKALKMTSNELVIAIQNALSVQEIKTINATLQQRIDDATDELQKSNEKLRSLDVAKDEFLSMASHQLRTPLTSVKGYISMVMEGDAGRVTKVQKQLLGEAFVSSERMVHLINDFLNVSRIQTGKFLIEASRVDMIALIKQEVAMLETTAQSRSITLKAKLPAGPVIADLDEGKIRQVIMNFIDNALYYSKPGTDVVVSLATTNKDVIVEIRDQGIGVPIAEQSRLFTKFFRAENARRQRPDGTGIGLYLAKRVVDGHGGKVLFSSTAGKGSMFGFKLPLAKQSDDTANN